MDDATLIIGVIVGLFALLAIVGTIIVYLRGTVAAGTIASLERSAAALKIELETAKITHDRERAEDAEVMTGLRMKVQELELKNGENARTIQTLRDVVTNADEVRAINTLLAEHHDASMGVLHKMEANLERVVIREGDRHGDTTDV